MGLQMDQNSLIMLSLDLPTPTHFTEMRENKKKFETGRFGKVKNSLAAVSLLMLSASEPTWHLQEVLDEPNVVLGL